MKVIINTGSAYKGGIIQVANSVIHEMRKFNDNEYHVILGAMLSKILDPADFPENFYFYKLDYRPATKVFTFEGPSKFFRELESKVKPDVVLSICSPAYWRPEVPHIVYYALPHYIYPESPFIKRLSLAKKIKKIAKGALIKYYLKNEADAYTVETDDVKERLKNWINNDNVYTITNTINSYFKDPDLTKQILPKRKEKEWRFLMLSAYYPHKNFEVINQISEALALNNDFQIKFIVTLPKETYSQVFNDSAKKIVHNVGPVKPEECPALYNEADFVFLPTLLECFSANYVEGMKMKKPILTSDLPFAHTVCKDAAVYFNPVDPKDIIQKMFNVIESPHLIASLKEKGFKRLKDFNTDEQRAKKMLEICSSLTENA